MSFEFTKDDMSDLKTILNMSNIKVKQEEVKQEFYCFIKNIMNNYPLLYSGFCKECVTSVKTKNHNETYGVHLLATGKIAEYFGGIFYDTNINILSKIIDKEDFKILCMETGYLHDIGKPFVRHEMKKRPMYIGHSQVGSCILNYILINKYKHEMEWVINNHMCNCTHMRPIEESIKKIASHMIISLSDETNHILAFALLSVISYSDQLGRLSVDKIDSELASIHSNNLFNKLLEEEKNLYKLNNLNFNGKIICILFGLAGSSKTFICNKIISTFSDKYDIVHIERDASLYKVYEKHIGSTVDKKYIDIYHSIYKDNSEISKHVVQKQWEQDLEDGLTTPFSKGCKEGQIILIDSVQPLYQYQWRLIIDSLRKHSEEAYAIYCNTTKIGYYGIPVHLIDISKETKIGKLSYLPNNSKDLFYPSVETETGNTSFISYGMGTFAQLNSYIKKYLELQKNKLSVIDPYLCQENLEVILNRIIKDFNLTELQYIYSKFVKLYLKNINFIKYRIEYEYNNIQMLTFLYDNGFETFNGITRDYRGEGFLFCKIPYPKFICIRPSLQVFPEMINIYKDEKVFPYILPIWDNIKCLQNSLYSKIKENIKEGIPLQIYLTSKYDGFMFNMTFIPDNLEVYEIFIELLKGIKQNYNDISHSVFKYKNGIFLFGSKRKILVKNTSINNSILGSYNSIEEFLDISCEYIYTLKEKDSIVTLHFESIDNIQNPELTVYYGKASCPFIGVTIFNQITHKKSFKLPLECTKFKDVANIIDCKNKWSNVIDIYNSNYKELLKGNIDIEPEGYVIHILTKNEENEDNWIHIKYKYDIYYAGYKPNSKHNKELSLELSSNDEYKILRQRLKKFKDKPSVENLLNKNIDKINSIKDILYDKTCNNFFDSNIIKKEWIIFWSKNKQLFFNIFNDLKLDLSEYYISFKDIIIEKEIFRFIVKIYEYKETKDIILNITNKDIIHILIKYIFA